MKKPSNNKLVMPFGLMYGRDLTDAQKVTAMWIVHYASRGSNNVCMASNKTLSICTGKSERQVRRDISSLCKAGYMVAEERGSNWPSANKRFDRTRFITIDAKVFKMPEKLMEQESIVTDLEMSGGEDMDVHLYNNNNKDYTLKEKTIATAAQLADITPFPLNIAPILDTGKKSGSALIIGAVISTTRTNGLIIGAVPATAAPPTPRRLGALFWHQVQKLRLRPRVEQVVLRLLDEGYLPSQIQIDRGTIVTVQKEVPPMAEKRSMPTELSLQELLQRVDRGELQRKPQKMTGSMQTTLLSKRLREITGTVQFVAQHTTRQMGQLKQFMKVAQSAQESPMEVLEEVASNWHEFGYHLQMAGKQKPREVCPDPGTLAYFAQECVNFYRKRKARGPGISAPPAKVVVPKGPGLVIGARPAAPTTGVTEPGQASTGVMTSEAFVEMVKRLKGN